ncbi:MAG TPA: fused MFS/spermidine synthase [Burkholderiales bacterium]|nr:fused MFS/spermidine synthase [Burkholderiales bacterium]
MLHAGTIFLSSFLLFLVQPLIARLILPWFGGSSAVWTTCLLFFQALLLAGYGYAHLLQRRAFVGRRQALVHIVLLAAALAVLPIAPADSWKPAGDDEPVSHILLLLGASVGLPYFLLAATSPLVQAWFAQTRPRENPYRLFAVSNLASLVALLGYPFVVEPYLSAGEQVAIWSWLFAAFAALCAYAAWGSPGPMATAPAVQGGARLRAGEVALWLALSATGSVLLLAVTNHLTQNVASVPLLWLAPLTLYLASFILTFEGGRWYRPERLWPLILLWLGAMAWLIADDGYQFQLPLQLAVFLPGLFLACLFCHGELYRARPAPRHLTAFYLIVSAGGALGGLLVAVVAPLVFSGYYELGIGLVVLGLLVAVRFARLPLRIVQLQVAARVASLAALMAAAGCAVYDGLRHHEDVLVATRSFYGVLRVKEYGSPTGPSHLRRLVHGTIMHGEQYMTPGGGRQLTTYYHEDSGVGGAIRAAQARGPARVGVIGLGTGTIAAYGRKGDVIRFYEIDSRVIEIAHRDFTYLAESPAHIELALGDARLTLEREARQDFNVLAIDAFSSDAIPVHLITREALGVYLRHVKRDGLVAFHVSNRFLELAPVVARLAQEHGAHAVLVEDEAADDDSRSTSDWVLVSRDPAALAHEEIVARGARPVEDRPQWRTWTDDYSNLVQILK